MRDLARVITRVVLFSVVALGLAAGLLGPLVEDDVEVSVVAMVTVAGATIAYEAVRAARRSGLLAWERTVPLWEARLEAAPRQPPSPLGEWEGLLAAARPNGDRSRLRLLRRMSRLADGNTQPLLDAIATADSEEFDDLVARFVEESRNVV